MDAGVRRLLAPLEGRAVSDSKGNILGHPGTMAPEMWLDPDLVGPAADLFSLGAVLYYASVGRFPYVGDESPPASALLEHFRRWLSKECVHEAMARAPNIQHLKPLVTRLLAPDPGQRPSSRYARSSRN